MKFPTLLLSLCLLLHHITAVKIGVSKITTTTKAPNTTMNSLPPEQSTTPMEDEVTTMPSTTTVATTTFRNFAVPTFPPRKSKTTPKTTTTTATTTATTKTTQESESAEATTRVSNGETYYCYCNLLLNACDINCCCDRDCTKEALKAFNCHDSPNHQLPAAGHSRLEDFQFQHGLPSCKINDGWLCVFRSNTSPEKKKHITANLDTSRLHKWSSVLVETLEESQDSDLDYYRVGDPLKVLNLETLDVQSFDLPFAFRPPHCQIHVPIRHLKPSKRSCLISSLEELHENKRKLLQLMATAKLLVKPQPQLNDLEQLEENLRPIHIRKCHKVEQKTECFSIKLENNTIEMDEDNYYATHIVVKIVHNYTNLIGGALVELHEQEINREIDEQRELWQTFEVQFIFKNYTSPKPEEDLVMDFMQLDVIENSGPLGYLQGKPIIIGKYIAYNSSREMSPSNQVLNYFHVNSTKAQKDHTLSLFTLRQGECFKNYNKGNLISYGISTFKQCRARLSNATASSILSDNLASVNFTAICEELQEIALLQLLGLVSLAEMPDIYISQLGKPQNRSDKWTRLEVKNSYEFAPVVGEFNAATLTFNCRNMLLSLSFEFHIGAFVEQEIEHQALVKHATLIVGQRNDLEFSLDETVEVPLSVSVMFYDIATNGGRHLVCNPLRVIYGLFIMLAVVSAV